MSTFTNRLITIRCEDNDTFQILKRLAYYHLKGIKIEAKFPYMIIPEGSDVCKVNFYISRHVRTKAGVQVL